jgi:hypothetical protein
MHGDNPAAFDEKPEDPGVELADVPELKQIVTYGFREWVPMVLAVPQFGESCENSRVVVRIGFFQFFEKKVAAE